MKTQDLKNNDFTGIIFGKRRLMVEFKTFRWRTYGKRVKSVKEIVNNLWKGAGIPYREFCDCCLFQVEEKSYVYNNYKKFYIWTVSFGRRIDPILAKKLLNLSNAIKDFDLRSC